MQASSNPSGKPLSSAAQLELHLHTWQAGMHLHPSKHLLDCTPDCLQIWSAAGHHKLLTAENSQLP